MIRIALVVFIAVGCVSGLAAPAVTLAQTGECSDLGTEFQRDMAAGWNLIVNGEDGKFTSSIHVNGKYYSTSTLANMTEEEREELAWEWVESQEFRGRTGDEALEEYRATLAECESGHAEPAGADAADIAEHLPPVPSDWDWSDATRPESGATPAACRRIADEFGGLGATDAHLGSLSGCRRDDRGEWFVPSSGDDPRLPDGPVLTETEDAATADLRATILDDLAAFGARLDDVPSGRSTSLRDEIDLLGSDPEGARRGLVIKAYGEEFDAFVTDPAHHALRAYAAWWVARRSAAVDRVCSSLAPLWCDGVENEFLAYPMPWHLSDDFTLDEYLAWALESGNVGSALPAA